MFESAGSFVDLPWATLQEERAPASSANRPSGLQTRPGRRAGCALGAPAAEEARDDRFPLFDARALTAGHSWSNPESQRGRRETDSFLIRQLAGSQPFFDTSARHWSVRFDDDNQSGKQIVVNFQADNHVVDFVQTNARPLLQALPVPKPTDSPSPLGGEGQGSDSPSPLGGEEQG